MGGVANRHVVHWSFLPNDNCILAPKEIKFNGMDMKKGWFCSEGRDSYHTIPTLQLRFQMPMPHVLKERLILERDKLGRIIHSKPPQM